MRKRMYLQLFEDGTGAGSNGQGGNNAGNDKYPSPGGRDLRQHKMDEEQAADCRDKAENKHSRFHLF